MVFTAGTKVFHFKQHLCNTRVISCSSAGAAALCEWVGLILSCPPHTAMWWRPISRNFYTCEPSSIWSSVLLYPFIHGRSTPFLFYISSTWQRSVPSIQVRNTCIYIHLGLCLTHKGCGWCLTQEDGREKHLQPELSKLKIRSRLCLWNWRKVSVVLNVLWQPVKGWLMQSAMWSWSCR